MRDRPMPSPSENMRCASRLETITCPLGPVMQVPMRTWSSAASTARYWWRRIANLRLTSTTLAKCGSSTSSALWIGSGEGAHSSSNWNVTRSIQPLPCESRTPALRRAPIFSRIHT